MSDQLKAMHEKIETIYDYPVDHIHADMLHRYIDEQAERIAKLEGALENQIATAALRDSVEIVEPVDQDTLPMFNIKTGEIEDPNGLIEDIGDGWHKINWTVAT